MRTDQETRFSRPGIYGGFGGYPQQQHQPPQPLSQARMYGSMQMGEPLKAVPQSFFARAQRQRLNVVPMFWCLVLPWLFFCGIYALVSFKVHYTSPSLCWSVAGAALAAVVLCGLYLVFRIWRRWSAGSPAPPKQPSWHMFMVASFVGAWVIAVVLGNLNFITNLQPYYDYMNLNEYVGVDPARMRGQQMMDGGRFFFTNNSAVDVRRSMGFKNLDTYCVAPISITSQRAGTVLPLNNYDFWAVGLDCCTSSVADFHCGDFANPSAHDGLRVLRDEQRPFFRLAVQQAEAAHGIKATHPLFVYWSRNANTEMKFFQAEGYKYYLVGMLAHFCWQLLVIALAVSAFAQLSG